jgi:hypothetical protein
MVIFCTALLVVLPAIAAETSCENGPAMDCGLRNRSSRQVLARAREIAEGLAKLPPLTTRHTRTAPTQKLRRSIDEGVGYGLARRASAPPDLVATRGSQKDLRKTPTAQQPRAVDSVVSISVPSA